jgi:hypothetical protein
MKYLRYILCFIPHALVVLLCWLTNPLVCLFPSRQASGRDKLWGIFNLWSTFDAPVDEGYYGSYFGANTPQGHYDYDHSAWLRYTYRLKWLSRNTGYGWAYLLFSIPRGTGFQWKGTEPFTEPLQALISLVVFSMIAWVFFPIVWAITVGVLITLYLVAVGYSNDFNVGWRDHDSMDKLDYAGRILGIRKNK